MTPEHLLRPRRIFDLGHEVSATMPVFGDHIPYRVTLHRRHGDPHRRERPAGTSFANELIVTSAHVSTHIDALGHFSRGGCVHGGGTTVDIESPEGLTDLQAGDFAPIWTRGILLDVASHLGVEVLDPGTPIDANLLADVSHSATISPEAGDSVLIRTGWSKYWDDPRRFAGHDGFPGLNVQAAAWLVERGAALIGSDTPVLEVIPFDEGSVHALLLVDKGVPIVENLALDELATAGVTCFLFVALPLRLVGATACPLRPIAVL